MKASVKAFMEASVKAFMEASVEVVSVEASAEAFVEVASVRASVEVASVEAFMEASVKAFMEASTAWKRGSFHWFHEIFHGSDGSFRGNRGIFHIFHGNFHELPPKMQIVPVLPTKPFVKESWYRKVGGKGRRGISFAWRQHRFFFIDFSFLLALSYEKLEDTGK